MSDVSYRVADYRNEIMRELACTMQYKPASKDILIVVHSQLPYLKKCIFSIRKHTQNYKILVWDNGSDEETSFWIKHQNDITSFRSEENLGFIIPNNTLAKKSNSEYIILLNSDTEVMPDWDCAMIAHIQQYGYSQVGYLGGFLDHNGKGVRFGFGGDVDYIPGWCFCIPKSVYNHYGLFDEKNLEFAYCEDSEFSLRITDCGEKIYSLHLGLCVHYENVTIKEVQKSINCHLTYEKNHHYIMKTYGHRLKKIIM